MNWPAWPVWAAPWVLLCLPLPLLVHWLLPPIPRDAAGSLRAPGLLVRLPLGHRARRITADGGVRLAMAAAWILLVIAAARPLLPAVEPGEVLGRDVLLALDLSDSMATADLTRDGRTVARAEAARSVLGELLDRRPPADRMGLIVFGRRAYLHTPLTRDRDALRAAFAEADVGLVGRETALGDAVALAVGRLREMPEGGRVLVLVTDGANTAGTLSPERAAWLAAREGVRIHALGVGGDRGLDEPALRQLADQTGGSYRRVVDAVALAAFPGELDVLEPQSAAASSSSYEEVYVWPLAGAVLLVIWTLLSIGRPRGRRP